MCIRDRPRPPPAPPGIAPRAVLVAVSCEARVRDPTRGGGIRATPPVLEALLQLSRPCLRAEGAPEPPELGLPSGTRAFHG
eukprot:7647716-Alexandrium_andersonii.AAC.1